MQTKQRQEMAKHLRSQDYTYQEIVRELNISTSTAHCNSSKDDLTCQRDRDHQGIHLSDETGKLVYWI